MTSSRTHAVLQRLSVAASLISGLVTATPAFCASPVCTGDHFKTGKLTLPNYDEAMAECIAQESAMTHPELGAFEAVRSCHDIGPTKNHGPWLHGRVGVDVVERRSGDRYTFEGLWMCKPVAEADIDRPSSR
ncbi:MAG TPA: hypothetical protein VM621_19375 [Luteibacter sp.]|uniref:hypothetical protein n=1 Tax=Luteibacter sp. TaxID=1886636 RepID=UPI002BE14A4D|nr:hypothetical protein [Luteibacter sp.]HVI57210.1 hypothetical protein [Luteibacter sp.]